MDIIINQKEIFINKIKYNSNIQGKELKILWEQVIQEYFKL
jgi:hypothetical protein